MIEQKDNNNNIDKKNLKGIILGFDFGMRRIGVATGQMLTQTATPCMTLLANNGIPDWQQLDQLVQEWSPVVLVVGLPIHMDGSPQFITEEAQQFAGQLQARYRLPLAMVDERLTSVEARDRLFTEGGYRLLKKSAVDSHAAKIILESWLRE